MQFEVEGNKLTMLLQEGMVRLPFSAVYATFGDTVLHLRMPDDRIVFTVTLPDAVVERIAQRAAEIACERQRRSSAISPWLDSRGAAEYIAAPVSRIHDLVSLGRLHPQRDGRRLVFARDDLDAYLRK